MTHSDGPRGPKLSSDDLWAMIVVALFFGGLAVVLFPGREESSSYLVGYGCEGSNGKALIGKEEDDFPPCSVIERVSDGK